MEIKAVTKVEFARARRFLVGSPMTKTQSTACLIIAVTVIGAGYFWIVRDTSNVKTLVTEAASRQLDRPVAVKIDLQNEIDNWVFICGSVTEVDGKALVPDTTGTRYESDDFCALADTKDADQLAEFDFGSTDMPAMDWLDRYDLDPVIFNSDTR